MKLRETRSPTASNGQSTLLFGQSLSDNLPMTFILRRNAENETVIAIRTHGQQSASSATRLPQLGLECSDTHSSTSNWEYAWCTHAYIYYSDITRRHISVIFRLVLYEVYRQRFMFELQRKCTITFQLALPSEVFQNLRKAPYSLCRMFLNKAQPQSVHS